jgi:hypothetical protein
MRDGIIIDFCSQLINLASGTSTVSKNCLELNKNINEYNDKER